MESILISRKTYKKLHKTPTVNLRDNGNYCRREEF